MSTKHTNDTKTHETKRLFIAVDISDQAREIASGIIRDLKTPPRLESGYCPTSSGVSFTKPENLHITLKFLGDTDASIEEKLVEMLQRIAADTPPFTLRFDGPELLGKRVMSIRIASDTPAAFDLEKRLDTECRTLGFKPEGRRFHPHLTLARIRNPQTAAPLSARFLQTAIPPAAFEASHLNLFESRSMPTGTVYLDRFSASFRM